MMRYPNRNDSHNWNESFDATVHLANKCCYSFVYAYVKQTTVLDERQLARFLLSLISANCFIYFETQRHVPFDFPFAHSNSFAILIDVDILKWDLVYRIFKKKFFFLTDYKNCSPDYNKQCIFIVAQFLKLTLQKK